MNARKSLAAMMVFVLVMSSLAGVASANEGTVTGIELDYSSSDYNSGTSSLEMYVEDDKVNVSVLANLSGSTSKRDVTTSATWKSSNSSIVKVDKGVLTGVGKGTTTISATYSGFTVSVKASSDFIYDEIIIMQDDQEAPSALTDIKLGESIVFTLDGKKQGTFTNITSEATWTTSSSSVATVDDGRIKLVGTGTATITAKYKGKSDTVKLTITSPYKGIEILPEPPHDLLELEMGMDDHILRAVAEPKTGGKFDVTDEATWTSGNTKVLTVEKGVITAVATGKTTITVSHLGVTNKIDVVVRTPYQSIRLSPEKEFHMQLQSGPLQVKAEVLSNDNNSYDITDVASWSSSDVTVATVVQGRVIPKAVGTTKITASHKGVSRSIDITIHPSIIKLQIEKDKIDGFREISAALPSVTATTFDGSTVDVSKLVKWTISDDEIASIEGNKWTAKKLGETTFTATVQNMKIETKLTVHLKPIKLIAQNKDLSIVLGRNSSLPIVNVIYEDGEEVNISESIEWTSKSDNILLLAKNMKGLEASTVTLTGTYLNKNVSVRVKIEEEIVRLVAEPELIELNPGRSKSIKVTGYYKSGKTISVASKIDWSSSNVKVATVSNSGSVKAIDVGTAKITGSYQGKPVEVTVVVTPKLKSLELSSKAVPLSPGNTFNVTLKANYFTGNPANATNAAVWTSSNERVATVKDGKITAIAKGSSTIRASFDGKSVTLRVTVN
ncbi:bacterial surface protein [Paenibacillus paeoniae]|uniref:Bacterial surface protein n=2 Tax=Paenibacillus paeoniae TaxID=2292705 RepID=A0A371P0S4_9BACL|nr:bacterial surface protein [Paenibacillus paeoniae]